MAEPNAGRPWMPGYGVPDSLDGALPWRWAEERLEACRNYFLATTRADGRPHVMPLWGLWLDNRFVFSTAHTSVKSRNLLADPRCAVTIDDGHHCVIVEGTAELVDSPPPGFIEAYKEKYNYELEDDAKWVLRPTVAFAFREDDTFSTSATRWEF